MKHDHDDFRTSRSERSDHYADVVLQSGRYRIIRCRNDHQWIVQPSLVVRPATLRWDNLRCHRDRNALIRTWQGLDLALADRSWPVLEALPPIYRSVRDGT